MPAFPALTHVALTVRDQAVSAPWYRPIIGEDPVIDEDTDAGYRHVVFVLGGDTLFGLHQHTQPAPDACESRAELEKWVGRLDELGITHGGIDDAPHGSGLSFRDPDGLALEFFAPPA